mgnify:CR=1 FL=1
MRRRREPDFCSSTVVRGSGFLRVRLEKGVSTTPGGEKLRDTGHVPLLRRLGLPFCYGRYCVVLDDREDRLGDVLVVQSTPAPRERCRRAFAHETEVNVPERLGYERLCALILVDDEPECRKLTRACRTRESVPARESTARIETDRS